MIYTTDFTTTEDTFRLPREYLEQLTGQGLEGLPELIRVVVNEAMRIERENYLQARPYERNEVRQGHANGYEPKTVKTLFSPVSSPSEALKLQVSYNCFSYPTIN